MPGLEAEEEEEQVITLILATIAWHWLTKTDGTSLLNEYTKAVWRWILVGCWIILSLEAVRKVLMKWAQ